MLHSSQPVVVPITRTVGRPRRLSYARSLPVVLAFLGAALLAPVHPVAHAAGVPVHYPAGWNLVSGPTGTVFNATGPAYSLGSSDAAYIASAGNAPVTGGSGYWVYFAADTTVTLNGAGSDSIRVSALADHWLTIGNPSGIQAATVTGADQALVWDATTGSYKAVTQLAVGQGAWALSADGGTITLTATGTALPVPTDPPAPTMTPASSLTVSINLLCEATSLLSRNSSSTVWVNIAVKLGNEGADGASIAGSLVVSSGQVAIGPSKTIRGVAIFIFDVAKVLAGAQARAHVDATLNGLQASADQSCTFS